eukprot:Gb_17140 [translate_table: standard]
MLAPLVHLGCALVPLPLWSPGWHPLPRRGTPVVGPPRPWEGVEDEKKSARIGSVGLKHLWPITHLCLSEGWEEAKISSARSWGGGNFDHTKFWNSSLSVGIFSKMVANEDNNGEALELFLQIGLDERTAQNAAVNAKGTSNLTVVIHEV